MQQPKPANVIQFVDRARQAATRNADRVERETSAERYRADCALRRERTAAIKMPDEVRRLVIADRLDVERFRSLRVVRSWLEHHSPALLLGGSTGRGKSIAGAYAIGQRGGLFFDAPVLLSRWRWSLRSHSREASEGRAIVDKAIAAPVLVIDDVGTEEAQDRELMGTMVFKLLSERSSSRTKTLITFNGGTSFFAESYADARLHSRLVQLSVTVIDKGPDLRLEAAGASRR